MKVKHRPTKGNGTINIWRDAAGPRVGSLTETKSAEIDQKLPAHGGRGRWWTKGRWWGEDRRNKDSSRRKRRRRRCKRMEKLGRQAGVVFARYRLEWKLMTAAPVEIYYSPSAVGEEKLPPTKQLQTKGISESFLFYFITTLILFLLFLVLVQIFNRNVDHFPAS